VEGTEITEVETTPKPVTLTTQAIENTKENIRLCEQLVTQVLEKEVDWGVMPGVAQPFLFDSGGAKLMAAYNCYPKYNLLSTTEDDNLITFAFECNLISRATGEVISTGIGACSTRETKYKYRWVSAQEALREHYVLSELKTKESKYGVKHRIPNPERGELVNTIAKMAAKRSDIDAVASLPGVSGALRKLFRGKSETSTNNTTKGKNDDEAWKIFWSQLNTLGVSASKVHEILGVSSVKEGWIGKGRSLNEAWQIIKQRIVEERARPAEPLAQPSPLKDVPSVTVGGAYEEPIESETEWEDLAHETEPKPKRNSETIKSLSELFAACHEDWGLQPKQVIKELGYSSQSEIVELPSECYRRILAVRGGA